MIKGAYKEDCENINEIASLIDVLTTIGWTKLYPETVGRLWCFRDAFRTYYNYGDISDNDLNKAVVYSFGVIGQHVVYNIYITAVNALDVWAATSFLAGTNSISLAPSFVIRARRSNLAAIS